MIHEVFHNLGVVPDCAPHQIEAGHVSDDPRDIMVTSLSAQLANYRDPSFLPLLDVGRDDYYGHTNRGCLDLANSTFLESTTRGAVPAPAELVGVLSLQPPRADSATLETIGFTRASQCHS